MSKPKTSHDMVQVCSAVYKEVLKRHHFAVPVKFTAEAGQDVSLFVVSDDSETRHIVAESQGNDVQFISAAEAARINGELWKHAALALFANAYADQADEADSPIAGEVMNALPDEIDSEAVSAANRIWYYACTINETNDALALYCKAHDLYEGEGDRELTPEMFAHYLVMQCLGHGVGLGDAFGDEVRNGIKCVHFEFYADSLSKNYFDN